MRTPAGGFYSDIHGTSKGLPQGVVLSPMLWIAFFDTVLRDLERCRIEPGDPSIRRLQLVYADDVTALVSAEC